MARLALRKRRDERKIPRARGVARISVLRKFVASLLAQFPAFPCRYPLSSGWDVWKRRLILRLSQTIQFAQSPRRWESIPGERCLPLRRARNQSSAECVRECPLRVGES